MQRHGGATVYAVFRRRKYSARGGDDGCRKLGAVRAIPARCRESTRQLGAEGFRVLAALAELEGERRACQVAEGRVLRRRGFARLPYLLELHVLPAGRCEVGAEAVVVAVAVRRVEEARRVVREPLVEELLDEVRDGVL